MQYFFSFLPLALKINGEYKGIIHTEPKGTTVKNSDFIEFASVSSEFLPLSFRFSSPPPQVRILTSRFGDFVYPTGLIPYPLPYEKLYYYELGEATVSIICDGGCKIILDGKTYLKVEALPSKPSSCEVLFSKDGHIGLLLNLNKPTVTVFNLADGRLELLSQGDKIEILSSQLIVKSFIPSLLSHTVTTTYSSDYKSREVSRNKSLSSLSPEQFKYAFLECVAIGDKLGDFLKEGLNESSLREFIGEFDAIMPSLSPTHDYTLISDRLKFIRLKMENGKIADVDLD